MGFWSSLKRAVKRAVKAVVAVVVEAVCRILRVWTAISTYFGFLFVRRLKLRVLILRDDNGHPLATPQEVLPVVERARDILMGSARIALEPTSGDFCLTINEFGPDVPEHALHLRGDGGGAVLDQLGLAGEFFDDMIGKYHSKADFPFNIPTCPLTCFIVREIDDVGGVAFPFVGNYLAIEIDELAPEPGIEPGSWIYTSLMAHEIGHCLGLVPHVDDQNNLMYKHSDRGFHLSRWQKVVARSSRCVSIT